MQTFMRRRAVEAATGLSRSSIYAGVEAGAFPRPVRLGPKSVAWLAADIEAWQNAKIAQRDAQNRAEAA